MDVARRGGIVLIDLGSRQHQEWVTGLRERGFDGPTVFLDPQGEVTIDLTDRVVVPSPPSLSGLLAGFEETKYSGPRPNRRRGSEAGERTPARRRRRTSAAPAITPRSDRPEGGAHTGGTERARRIDRAQAVEDPGSPRLERGAVRARRGDRLDASQEQVAPRAR